MVRRAGWRAISVWWTVILRGRDGRRAVLEVGWWLIESHWWSCLVVVCRECHSKLEEGVLVLAWAEGLWEGVSDSSLSNDLELEVFVVAQVLEVNEI